MTRTDWIGLGTSILLHVGLGLLAASLTASKPPPQKLGYVEVEFGEFSAGQPVDATDEMQEEAAPTAEEKTPEPETEPEEQAEEPQTEQVDLPKEEQSADEETIPPTEEEAEPPETQPKPEKDQTADEQEPSAEPGENEQGDPGEGATEEASAPYNIEGLDRDPDFAPLPSYTEKVNARIRVQITVNPEGRIVRRIPLIKGNPKLEAAVMDALQRWRFNPLPPAAPQENQTGTITFTFRLE